MDDIDRTGRWFHRMNWTRSPRASSSPTGSPPAGVPPAGSPPPGNPPLPPPSPPDIKAVYTAYAGKVHRHLQRLGVHPNDLEDLTHEVFIIVHRKLPTFDPAKPLAPWLHGICKKRADRYRRNAYTRRVTPVDVLEFDDMSCKGTSPEQRRAREEARAELNELLDELDPDKREILVMYEIDGMDCAEIAQELGIPLGTVHSRLSAARKALLKAYNRREAKRQGKPWW